MKPFGSGREIIKVTTDKPDDIESVEAISEFLVFPSQLPAQS